MQARRHAEKTTPLPDAIAVVPFDLRA